MSLPRYTSLPGHTILLCVYCHYETVKVNTNSYQKTDALLLLVELTQHPWDLTIWLCSYFRNVYYFTHLYQRTKFVGLYMSCLYNHNNVRQLTSWHRLIDKGLIWRTCWISPVYVSMYSSKQQQATRAHTHIIIHNTKRMLFKVNYIYIQRLVLVSPETSPSETRRTTRITSLSVFALSYVQDVSH